MSQFEELKARLRDGWFSEMEPAANAIESLERQLAELQPFADVGKAMVEITTTVQGVDEWGAIPTLWTMCMEERDTAIKKLATVTAQRDSLEGALELMLERIQEPPDRNCSCHISPPCNDCVDFGGEREAFEVAKEALASLKGE